jgi:hypothetical protein
VICKCDQLTRKIGLGSFVFELKPVLYLRVQVLARIVEQLDELPLSLCPRGFSHMAKLAAGADMLPDETT